MMKEAPIRMGRWPWSCPRFPRGRLPFPGGVASVLDGQVEVGGADSWAGCGSKDL